MSEVSDRLSGDMFSDPGMQGRSGIGVGSVIGAPLFLLGVAVGSLAMYFWDPVQGRRRRALLRDKGAKYSSDLADLGRKRARDLSNRAGGFISEMTHVSSGPVDDKTLVSRVRSEFGRKVTSAKAIKVKAENGVVTLSGKVPADEVEDLLACVAGVEGVKEVKNEISPSRSRGQVDSPQEYLH